MRKMQDRLRAALYYSFVPAQIQIPVIMFLRGEGDARILAEPREVDEVGICTL